MKKRRSKKKERKKRKKEKHQLEILKKKNTDKFGGKHNTSSKLEKYLKKFCKVYEDDMEKFY